MLPYSWLKKCRMMFGAAENTKKVLVNCGRQDQRQED